MKIGDKVICVNDDCTGELTKGNEYTVYNFVISRLTFEKYVMLRETSYCEWSPSRFKVVNKQFLPDELFEL